MTDAQGVLFCIGYAVLMTVTVLTAPQLAYWLLNRHR